MPFPEGYANFSGPAGGRSLALAALITWCEALWPAENLTARRSLDSGGSAMNMSEMGTFGTISYSKLQHLEISLNKPSGFEESFRMTMPLLHFVDFHPGTLATILTKVGGLSAQNAHFQKL